MFQWRVGIAKLQEFLYNLFMARTVIPTGRFWRTCPGGMPGRCREQVQRGSRNLFLSQPVSKQAGQPASQAATQPSQSADTAASQQPARKPVNHGERQFSSAVGAKGVVKSIASGLDVWFLLFLRCEHGGCPASASPGHWH